LSDPAKFQSEQEIANSKSSASRSYTLGVNANVVVAPAVFADATPVVGVSIIPFFELTFTIASVLDAGVLGVLMLKIAVGCVAIFITVGNVTMFVSSLLSVERPSLALVLELSP
jgi:hypothetical protein